MVVVGMVTLEKITSKLVLKEIVVEEIIKHFVEVEVCVMVEPAVTLGAEEGIEIERTSLLASCSLGPKPVVLFPFVLV